MRASKKPASKLQILKIKKARRILEKTAFIVALREEKLSLNNNASRALLNAIKLIETLI